MRIVLAILCFLFLVASLPAQSNYAEITGSVTDAQGLPIAGAIVHFNALTTGAIRSATANERGLFYAPGLLPGDYELTTQADGFAPVTQSLRLEVGQNSAITIKLKIGPVREGVQVSATAQLLRTTDASVGEVVEPKSIQELPLNGRMLIDLVLTVPGAHVGFGAQTGETNPLY